MGRVPVQPPVDAAVVRGDVGDQALDTGLDGADARDPEEGAAHAETMKGVNHLEGDLGRGVVLAHPAHDPHGHPVALRDERDVSPGLDVGEVPQHPWRQLRQPGVVPGDS